MKILKARFIDDIEAHELSIDTHGLNFLCIFGEHINGGFISVLNWNVSAEISFNSFGYSRQALASALRQSSQFYMIGDQALCDEIADDIIMAVFQFLGCLDSEVEEVSEPELEVGFYKVVLSERRNEEVPEKYKPGYNFGTFSTYTEARSLVEYHIENDLEEYGQSDVYQILYFNSDGDSVIKTDTFFRSGSDVPFNYQSGAAVSETAHHSKLHQI